MRDSLIVGKVISRRDLCDEIPSLEIVLIGEALLALISKTGFVGKASFDLALKLTKSPWE